MSSPSSSSSTTTGIRSGRATSRRCSCRSRASRGRRPRSSSTASSHFIRCARRLRSRMAELLQSAGSRAATTSAPASGSKRSASTAAGQATWRAPSTTPSAVPSASSRRARRAVIELGLRGDRSSITMPTAIRRRPTRSRASPRSRSVGASRMRRRATSRPAAAWDALGRERITTNEQNVVDPPASRRPARARDRRRPPPRIRTERPASSAPSRPMSQIPRRSPLEPPAGTPALETSYVLNGNPAGHLDPAGRVFETTGFDGSRAAHLLLRADAAAGRRRRLGLDVRQSHASRSSTPTAAPSNAGRSTDRACQVARWNAEYDGRDRIVAEWFGGSQATRIERAYDLLGRAVATDDPDAGSWRVRYDEAGNEIFRDDPKPSESIQSCYDGLNRVVLQCVRTSDAPDPGLCAIVAADLYHRLSLPLRRGDTDPLHRELRPGPA